MTRFRELRKTAGISQAQLAAIVNVDQTAVSKWELGKSFPDMEIAMRVADYFEVSVDYLLGRTNEKAPGVMPRADDDIDDALIAMYGEVKDELSEDDIADIKDFIAFKAAMQRKREAESK